MHTDSELESDTGSINDGMSSAASSSNLANIGAPIVLSKEQFEKRIESLVQENRVLKIEIDTFKLRVRSLQEENKELRKASVNIQVCLVVVEIKFREAYWSANYLHSY